MRAGSRDITRIFQRGGSHCQIKGTHQIVKLFWQPAVDCFLKKGFQKGVSQTP